jgi:hypothetical protein
MIMKTKTNISKIKSYSKVTHVVVALALVVSMGLVMIPLTSVGGATQTEEFTESGAFIVPAGVTEITVEMWGGGGAGGGSTSAGGGSARGGAGGGGGAYVSSILTVEPGQELEVVIGTGGTGVSGDDGNLGSYSFVGIDTNPDNAFVRAAGGSGGMGNTAGGDPAAGAGGTVEDSIGQIRIAGANGGDGATGKGCRSGDGGEGAYNGGGDGGAAVTSGNGDGNPGDVPGGGGGGARTQGNGGPRIGGGGAAGKVIIAWVTYDLTISSIIGGSVATPGEGAFTYIDEAVVDLIAVASDGYCFVEWTGDVDTIDDVYAAVTNITMNGDYSITANFVAIHDLTTSSTEGGSVTEPGEDTFTYDDGMVVDLIAEAEEGSWFIEWIGDVNTIADIYATTTTIIMNDDYSITANFVATYDLTVSSTEGGSLTTPGEGVFTYGELSVISLTAEAEEDYRFVGWTGDIGTVADVYSASTTITMNGDYSITANFEDISSFQYDLTTSSIEGGSVMEPGEGVFTYDGGAVVDLVATPDEGYQFDEWTGDVGTIADIEADVTTITIDGDYSIAANFVAAPSGGCFIATAAYGTPTAEQIDVLRDFRDTVLLESIPGSLFVSLYYKFSPPVADFIAGNEPLRTLVREFLIDPIVRVVEATGDMWWK